MPKLGVATPVDVCAVTVAAKLSPALMNFAPVALAAAGLAKFGLAVCATAETAKPAGRVTKAFEEPLSTAELTVLVAHKVVCPTSAKVKLKGALPFASKVMTTGV